MSGNFNLTVHQENSGYDHDQKKKKYDLSDNGRRLWENQFWKDAPSRLVEELVDFLQHKQFYWQPNSQTNCSI